MGNEKIYEFLKKSGLAKKDLALKCKLNPTWFCSALKHNKIGPRTADKLDYHTQGQIPYESLTDLPRPKKAKRRKRNLK
ncbi:MAG TPA: hypothetical protein VIH61_05650 [Waddliaceae bacterium]